MVCSFGTAPSAIIPQASPQPAVVESRPACRITDIVPINNIPPFAMCTSLANPTVASATAAASGVLTPMPCVPVTVGPWKPGAPTTTIGGIPALTVGSTCQCGWGGVITFTGPGAPRSQAT